MLEHLLIVLGEAGKRPAEALIPAGVAIAAVLTLPLFCITVYTMFQRGASPRKTQSFVNGALVFLAVGLLAGIVSVGDWTETFTQCRDVQATTHYMMDGTAHQAARTEQVCRDRRIGGRTRP